MSLTLSDSFCVDRHRDDFAALVDDVDILFGNEDELCSLYEVDSLDEAIAGSARSASWRRSRPASEGSYVVTADGVVEVPAEPVARVLDTTGAGDLYAAGFLYGLTTTARGVRADRLDRRRRGDQPRRPRPSSSCVRWCVSEPGSRRSAAERWLAAEPDDDISASCRRCSTVRPRTGRPVRRQLDVRHGGAAAADRRRSADEPARRAPGGRGLADHLRELDRTVAERSVVIGYDARRKSDVFALDTARVMAAAGLPGAPAAVTAPTPVLAWAVTEIGCDAGVMVTASHNPPTDNGYKVYLDGAQIVPPHDGEIAARSRCVDAGGAPRRRTTPLIDDPRDGVTATSPRCRRADAARRRRGSGWPTRRCTESAGRRPARLSSARRLPIARWSSTSSSSPTGRFRPYRPEPGGAGGNGPACSPSPTSAAPSWRSPTTPTLTAWGPPSRSLGFLAATRRRRDRLVARRPHPANTTGDDRLVITTLVSSPLLGDMARARGARQGDLHRV